MTVYLQSFPSTSRFSPQLLFSRDPAAGTLGPIPSHLKTKISLQKLNQLPHGSSSPPLRSTQDLNIEIYKYSGLIWVAFLRHSPHRPNAQR